MNFMFTNHLVAACMQQLARSMRNLLIRDVSFADPDEKRKGRTCVIEENVKLLYPKLPFRYFMLKKET